MNNMTEVKALLEKSLPDCKVEVEDLTGTADHLGLKIVSPAFEGLSLLKQHQMVMDILKDSLKEKIHAVKIKTLIP